MSELKNCPFCGGEAEFSRGSEINNWVFCASCISIKNKDGARSGFYETPKEAAKAWNNRVDRWIPVLERLPENEDDVMVVKEERLVLFGAYFKEYGLWYSTGSPIRGITHWMPLPAPPEGVEQG